MNKLHLAVKLRQARRLIEEIEQELMAGEAGTNDHKRRPRTFRGASTGGYEE